MFMFKAKSDHVVFKCEDILATRHFYESVLGFVPTTILDHYVTYDIGGFFLCFQKVEDIKNPGASVMHIGIDFPLRADVDAFFAKIRASEYAFLPEKILGGPGQGPYRFYVKDPSGYTLEFESWEDCSD